jgi:peptidoglycan/LPS O-acetylase OafA/YrhL
MARVGDSASGVSARVGALDGIRAIAVLAVLAFHGGISEAAGGMFGVDVFFVLSGFLITGLLLSEHARSGRIGLKHFWARRARRLLPALVVTVAGALALARWGGGAPLSQVRGDAIGALLYVSNWHLILAHQNYFNRYGAPSPLLHTWSLGIEEQFYLFWPLIVVALLRRRGPKAVTRTAVAGALTSSGLMWLLDAVGEDKSRLYFGTDTRAQSLLVGAALAGYLATRREGVKLNRGWVAGFGLVSLAGLAWMIHAVGDTPWIYDGGFLLVAICAAGLVASAVLTPAGLLSRVLSVRPLVAIGRISYGLYLYHWPLFLWLNGPRVGLTGWPLRSVQLVVTFAVAIISWFVIEEPVRTRSWRLTDRRRLLAPAGASFGLIIAATGLLAVSVPQSASGQVDGGFPVPTSPPFPLGGRPPIDAIVVGDSLGVTLYEGLSIKSVDWGVALHDGAALGCDLDPTSTVAVMGVVSRAAQGCPDWRTAWAQVIDRDDPQVVVVMLGRWETINHVYQGHWTWVGQPAWDDHLQTEIEQAIDILSARGAKVELLTLPYVQQTTVQPDGKPWDMNLPSRTDAFNSVLRAAAANRPGRAVVVDLNSMVDPDGRYTSSVDHVRVRNSDDEHFSVAGGEWLRPRLLPGIESLGIAVRLRQSARAAGT